MLWLFRGSSKECLLHWMQSQAAFSNSHHQFSRRGKIEESKLETSFSLHFLSCTKVHFNWISLSGTKSHTILKVHFLSKKENSNIDFYEFLCQNSVDFLIFILFNEWKFWIFMKKKSRFLYGKTSQKPSKLTTILAFLGAKIQIFS